MHVGKAGGAPAPVTCPLSPSLSVGLFLPVNTEAGGRPTVSGSQERRPDLLLRERCFWNGVAPRAVGSEDHLRKQGQPAETSVLSAGGGGRGAGSFARRAPAAASGDALLPALVPAHSRGSLPASGGEAPVPALVPAHSRGSLPASGEAAGSPTGTGRALSGEGRRAEAAGPRNTRACRAGWGLAEQADRAGAAGPGGLGWRAPASLSRGPCCAGAGGRRAA